MNPKDNKGLGQGQLGQQQQERGKKKCLGLPTNHLVSQERQASTSFFYFFFLLVQLNKK